MIQVAGKSDQVCPVCQIWLVKGLICALSYGVTGETRNWTITSKFVEFVHVTVEIYRMKGYNEVDYNLLEMCSLTFEFQNFKKKEIHLTTDKTVNRMS